MEFDRKKLKWLEKAKAQDITKHIFANKRLKESEKKEIQKKWIELHKTKEKIKQAKLLENWGQTNDWK